MSQVVTGPISTKALNVPVLPMYGVSRGNDDKTEKEILLLKNSLLKSTPVMKSNHWNEEKNVSSRPLAKSTSNHVTFMRTYKVIYLGYAVLDRRYTLPMLPWVIAEIRRHGSQNMEEIFIEVVEQSLRAVKCETNQLVFEHKLQSLSKFAQSSHDTCCFTYMTREVANGPCAYHVFQANDDNTVSWPFCIIFFPSLFFLIT